MAWLSQDEDEEFDDGGLLQALSPETLLVLGIIALVVLIVAAVVGWLLLRRLRRSRTVRHWTGAVRTQMTPEGPLRELSELRGELQGIQDRTREAVLAAEARGTWRDAPADLPTLATRLEETAAGLADRLAGYARQPEQRVAEILPDSREQVRLMGESERTLHRGLELASLSPDGGDLGQLQRDMTDEVQALQAYRDAYRRFEGGRGNTGP